MEAYVRRSHDDDDDMDGAYRHFAFHTFLFNEPIVRRMNVTMRINTETFTKDNFLLFCSRAQLPFSGSFSFGLANTISFCLFLIHIIIPYCVNIIRFTYI